MVGQNLCKDTKKSNIMIVFDEKCLSLQNKISIDNILLSVVYRL